MSDIGTFGNFTTARLGIYAAQKGLSVTGNNIANINTLGYTRQSLDQASLKLGSSDRYQSRYNVSVGSGVLCVGVSQLRDPYLDIRYRTEMSNVGAMDSKLSGLDQIASILDEVAKNNGDGILEKQLTDLMGALQDLSTGAGQNELDSAVRSAASTLTQLLNSYAKKLDEVKDGTVKDLRQDVNTVNDILENIRDLNASIRKSEIHGDNALEQRDQRNTLIDQLSQYIKIDVSYTTEEIGEGHSIENLVIRMGGANPDPDATTDSSILVDGIFATQLLTPKENPARAADDYDQTLQPGDAGYEPSYLTVNGEKTDDPSKAAQEFNDNYDIILGALTSAKGTVQSDSRVQTEEILAGAYPPEADRNPPPVDDGHGHSITTSFYSKDITTPAKVEGDPVTGAVLDAINLLSKNIAKVAGGDATLTDGPITISYTDGKFQLLANGTKIGESEEVTLPSTENITFKSAGGINLGSIKLTADTDATAFGAPVTTGLTYHAATTETKYYKKTVTTEYSTPIGLDDNDLYGSLQSTREMLTEKGEFSSTAEIAQDKDATIKRGIPYYQKMMDALAVQIATQFNNANSTTSANGYETYISDVDGKAHYKTVEGCALTFEETLVDLDSADPPLADDVKADIIAKQNLHLKSHEDGGLGHGYAVTNGGNLFSNSGAGDDATNITAKNISISHSWSTGDVRIVTSAQPDAPSQANDNILHMISLFTTKLDYTTSRVDPDDPTATIDSTYFHGTFQEMLANMTGTLANDIKSTGTMLDNYYASAVELDTSRDSVSSVDLNEEAMSMMQYQKSYAAACRLMTTLDETLDKLINSTGIVGR